MFLVKMHVPIVISVADDDDFLSKEELLSIQRGLEDIKKWQKLTECRRVRALRTS